MQALGELACLYPENGAFNVWAVRFIDVSSARQWLLAQKLTIPWRLAVLGFRSRQSLRHLLAHCPPVSSSILRSFPPFLELTRSPSPR